jgi:hypothetical protein
MSVPQGVDELGGSLGRLCTKLDDTGKIAVKTSIDLRKTIKIPFTRRNTIA